MTKFAIFLGAEIDTDASVICPLDTHALTIAGPRTGKGSSQIIPTLRDTWRGNVICIDPKGGENFRQTVAHREAMGQKVVCIDPIPNPETEEFISPKENRVRFNPLDLVRRGGAGIRDLNMLADGLVLVSESSRDPFWEKTARTLIAGTIAFILERAPAENRNLARVRDILRGMSDPNLRDGIFAQMDECQDYGKAAAQAASYMRREGGKSDSIYTTAAEHVAWLGDSDMAASFTDADFDLNAIRKDNIALYLILPADALEGNERYLRLFVRCALAVMKRGEVDEGRSDNRHCLFVLDEFKKLGRLDVIADDAGFMPGYGVHLWPILQDIGQLHSVYGLDAANTFKGGAQVITAFGLWNDLETASYISKLCGNVTDEDIEGPWLEVASQLEEASRVANAPDISKTGSASEYLFNKYARAKFDDKGGFFRHYDRPPGQDFQMKARIDLMRSRLGKPRFPPEQVIQITAKRPGDDVADRMFAFVSGELCILRLQPYFHEKAEPEDQLPAKLSDTQRALAMLRGLRKRLPMKTLSWLGIRSGMAAVGTGEYIWKWVVFFRVIFLWFTGIYFVLVFWNSYSNPTLDHLPITERAWLSIKYIFGVYWEWITGSG